MELSQLHSKRLDELERQFSAGGRISASLKKSVLDLVFLGVPLAQVSRRARVHPSVIRVWIKSFDSYCSYKLKKIKPYASRVTTRDNQVGQKVCVIKFNSGSDLKLSLSQISPRTKKSIEELA